MFYVITGYVHYVGYWQWIIFFLMTTITIVVVNIDYPITEKKGTDCFKYKDDNE